MTAKIEVSQSLIENIQKQLTKHEDKRNKLYKDSKGLNTIGIGHNLDHKPISDRAVAVIFEDDLNDVLTDVKCYLPWALNLDEARLGVIINMCFNMGAVGLVTRNPLMLAACKAGDYKKAAEEMLDGPWKSQVGQRAYDLAKQMETNIWQI